MADAPEPPGEAAGDTADEPVGDAVEQPDPVNDQPVAPPRPQPRARRSSIRRLDRRTVAICAVVALLASLIAALAFVAIVGDDDPAPSSNELELSESDGGDPAGASEGVDVDRLLGLRIETDAGDATTLDQLRGEGRTLVNFWQSACGPCVREMPRLQAASEANPDVTFLGANVLETDEGAATDLLEQTGVTYGTFDDPDGTLYAAAGLSGLPATVLLGPDGAVLAAELGEFTTAAELQAFLDDHPA